MNRSSLCTRAFSTRLDPSRLPPIVFHYLPHPIPYARGLLLQETLVSRRLAARKSITIDPTNQLENSIASTDILLLLQHRPVYTAGRRENDLETAQKEGERLGKLRADYIKTMRGGQTTYHGPGQLVGYPIMDLGLSKLSTREYVEVLEGFLAQLAIHNNIPVLQPSPHTGVFTSLQHKVGSIGIHIRHRITLHGFSLNVEEQVLQWFKHIVACGLDDVSATSIETELKKLGLEGGLRVEDVVPGAVKLFGDRFDRNLVPIGEEHDWLKKIIQDGIEGKLDDTVI